MPEKPRRIVLEKSRSVRRRYQRSNHRLQYTPSQIQRIERDEERERRAKKLQDKEKKRVANKKKKAEKEARSREERRRLNKPDPDAAPPSASQPLLLNFLAPAKVGVEAGGGTAAAAGGGGHDGHDGDGDDTEGQVFEGFEPDFDLDSFGENTEGQSGNDSTPGISERGDGRNEPQAENDEDDFSDCSIFYDEDIIKRADTESTAQGDTGLGIEQSSKIPHRAEKADTESTDTESTVQGDTGLAIEQSSNIPQRAEKAGTGHTVQGDTGQSNSQSSNTPRRAELSKEASPAEDSFQDETAAILEESFFREPEDFGTDEEFENELVKLDVAVSV